MKSASMHLRNKAKIISIFELLYSQHVGAQKVPQFSMSVWWRASNRIPLSPPNRNSQTLTSHDTGPPLFLKKKTPR